MSGDMICNNPVQGHVILRCKGCNSHHTTKNIGYIDEQTLIVSPQRSIFDTFGDFCRCKNPLEYPLIHDCEVDDVKISYHEIKGLMPYSYVVRRIKNENSKRK